MESCRAEGYSYAIENIVDKECHCSKVLDTNLVKLSPHSCNEDRKYRVTPGCQPQNILSVDPLILEIISLCSLQVYEVDLQDQSPTCDHLYFQRSIFYWQSYSLTNGLKVKCQYSRPSALVGSAWDQDQEKLARKSLMFADSVSSESPAQGVKVEYDSDGEENLWESTAHKISLPWDLDTGFKTGTDGKVVTITFGNPDRSALIWGIRFLKEQLAAISGGVSLELSYNYFKDVERGIYSSTAMRKPDDDGDGHLALTIQATDLDDNGLYFFTEKLTFVASKIFIKLNADFLNFDFIGTFFDFTTASTGKHSDGKNDQFHNHVIGYYLLKSKDFHCLEFQSQQSFLSSEDASAEGTVSTTDESVKSSRDLCRWSCSKDFYAVRRYTDSQFKCRCFDRDEAVLVGVDDVKSYDVDPRNYADCDVAAKVYVDQFDADTDLLSWLKESTLALTTTEGQVDNGKPNFCVATDVGRANRATVYLASALGLDVGKLVDDFVFDTYVGNYTFPNSSVQSYPPEGAVLTSFPSLDQVYWTIISQYTRFTVHRTNYGKSSRWCWFVGAAVYDHCVKLKPEMGCSEAWCSRLWKPFIEACHRVRHLDTSVDPYKYKSSGQYSWCLPSDYSSGAYTDVTLYEVSRE